MSKASKANIFISGTSSGIGKAIAYTFLKRGHVICGCSRSSASIFHENYIHYECDLTVEADVNLMIKSINIDGFYPSILINNAGREHSALALKTDFKDINNVLLLNTIATMNLTNSFLTHMMRKNKGRIINILSICAPLGLRGSATYSASKKAIEGYVGCLINEVKDYDISINNLGLSYVEATKMSKLQDNKIKSQTKHLLAKNSEISVKEIIHGIDFFINEKAKNITGQTLYYGGVS